MKANKFKPKQLEVEAEEDEIDSLLASMSNIVEAADKGEVGIDPEFQELATPAHMAILSESKRQIGISMKISPKLIEELRALAEHDGLPYQTYLKIVLKRHVEEMKKKRA